MNYEYKNPEENGYIKFSISNKEQNEIFKYRKSKWSYNYEFYANDSHIIMYQIPNTLGCIACTFLFPIALILEGLSNYKEVYKDMILRTWQCKKYGAFSGDDIYKDRGDTFDILINIMNKSKVN